MQRNLVRIISTVAAAGLVAAVLATSAIANLEGCRNCVEAGDIADGAVRADELNDFLANSIDANDIATGGVRRLELAANSVGFSEMGDNAVGNGSLRNNAVGLAEMRDGSVGLAELLDSVTPGAGFLAPAGSFTTTTTTPETLEQFNITVPGDGYLLVQVGGRLWLNNDDADTPADDVDDASVGLCDAADSFASCGQASNEVRFFSAFDTTDDDNPTDVMYLARLLTVTAGTKTVFLNAQAAAGADTDPAHVTVDSVQLSAIFIPATLNITAGT